MHSLLNRHKKEKKVAGFLKNKKKSSKKFSLKSVEATTKKHFAKTVLSLCSKTVLLRLLFIFLTFRLPDMLSKLNPTMYERRNIQVSSQVFLLRKLKLQQVLLDLQDDALQSQQEFLFQ